MPTPSPGSTVLVVGGAGPTGRPLIEGLLSRGQRVTMLHSGRHKPKDDWYQEVEKIYANAFDAQAFEDAIAGRSWGSAFVMYGKLRAIVRVLKGRVCRLITVGGVPSYHGFGVPELLRPQGMLVPQWEDSRKGTHDGTLSGTPLHPNPKANAVVETERVVCEVFPKATHFRYPWIYGDDGGGLWEWSVVKRVLDGRKQIILADGGLTLLARGYVQNVAAQLLLAFDRPEESEGETYNAGDEQSLTCRQLVEVIADALGAQVEIVSMPADLAIPAWPMLRKPDSTHESFDVGKLRWTLGYRDVLPVVEATERTARYLAAHPPDERLAAEFLQDPFDYEAEDELILAWKRGDVAGARAVKWRRHPGFTAASYSTAVNPFDGLSQTERHEGVYDPLTGKRKRPETTSKL